MNGLGFERDLGRYAENVRGGDDFERYVQVVLESVGLTVYRSAASQGCADLLVRNDRRRKEYTTIQCKKHGRVRYVRESGHRNEDVTSPDATANDVPDLPVLLRAFERLRDVSIRQEAEIYRLLDRGLSRLTPSARASAPSVGSPSSEGVGEEAST